MIKNKAFQCTTVGIFLSLVIACGLLFGEANDVLAYSTVPDDNYVCLHESVGMLVTPSTCSEDGIKNIVCNECNFVVESSVLHTSGHSFGEWENIVKPTSCKDGLMERICEECGETESRNTPYVFIASNPDITLSYEYVNDNKYMPYGLITPSSAALNDKTPLIVSLHGMGDVGSYGPAFSNKFVAKAMQEWKLDGFNAYVLFPHLPSCFGSWNSEWSAEKLFDLIDYIVVKYNIDRNKIVITGQSLGGMGTLYMAAYRPDFFSAIVPISPFPSNANLNNINKETPFRCYIGSSMYGEASKSEQFTLWQVKNIWGDEKIFQRNVSHDAIPVLAFTEDLNGDNKSDLIEWMLQQSLEKSEMIEPILFS